GTPMEIYDSPANTFVAGFIGSPAMNLVDGDLSGGVFRAEGIELEGLDGPDGAVTLGFRAEDAAVAQLGGAHVSAPVYTLELLGEATMVTVRLGGAMVSVKAGKDFRAEIGEPIAFSVPSGVCHLFERNSGMRRV
ncbi:MAG: TOBE domain-containing protein, partial [Pseudomonadota bacterium]